MSDEKCPKCGAKAFKPVGPVDWRLGQADYCCSRDGESCLRRQLADANERKMMIVRLLQRKLQPPGSPPPGDELVLAVWIIEYARAEMERMQRTVDTLTIDLARRMVAEQEKT